MSDNIIESSSIALRTSRFHLENWLVEPVSNHLQCLSSGAKHRLEPRLMHLLCILASAPGTVFTRDQLIRMIWPRVVVTENSLTRAVSELRKILEFKGSDRAIIHTIPKTGYRLSPDCSIYIPAIKELTPQGALHRSNYWLSGMATAASLVLAVGILIWTQSPPDIHDVTRTPPAVVLGDINVTNADAVSSLMSSNFTTVSSPAGGEPRPFEKNQKDSIHPVVSKDGALFAYISYSEKGSSLLLGSTEQPESAVTVLSTQDTLFNLQWSPLHRALMFALLPKFTQASLHSVEEQASLVLFDLETFSTRVIYGPQDETAEKKDNFEESDNFKLTSHGQTLDWLS
jgi:DNA-binding winged helix-turn-helix (wHTH) protein